MATPDLEGREGELGGALFDGAIANVVRCKSTCARNSRWQTGKIKATGCDGRGTAVGADFDRSKERFLVK